MAVLALAAVGIAASAPGARAGPPYRTEDTEVVELHHWELYLASQWAVAREVQAGTLPHGEINYGALPGVQLHLLIPAVLAHTTGRTAYGLGDVELGAEWRFVRSADHALQIATYPLATLPTGSEVSGLGVGRATLFLPLWAQGELKRWVIDGGGGFRFHPAGNDVELGVLLRRKIGPAELGTEVYVTLPTNGSAVVVQIDVGATIDFTEHQHLLISAGPSAGAGTLAQAYLAYLVTL